MLFSRVFAATQPRTIFMSLPTACAPPRGSNSHRNVFRINTYKSLSKQTTLTVMESHSYKKHGGRGLLWLTRNPKRDFYPERPSGAEGPLFRSRSGFLARGIRRSHVPTCYRSDVPTCLQPSFVFKGFHTLSFSVSRKSFAYHSYDNCRVYTNNSHSGTQRSFSRRHTRGAAMNFHQSRVTSHKSPACPPISERSTIASLPIEEGTRHGHR